MNATNLNLSVVKPDAVLSPSDLSLPQLADRANKEHASAGKSGMSMVEHAIRAGQYLAQAKAQLAHGEWLPWLEGNFDGSGRMARRYMRVAANWTRVSNLDELSLRNALTAIDSALTREEKRAGIKERLEAIAGREAVEPTGLYDVIVIDPPWPMKKIERDERPNQSEFEYPTMSEEDLRGLELPCADDCHVWLWTTHRFLPFAFELLEEWGLKYVCTFVWHKPGGFQPVNLPQYNCEFALYARQGSPMFLDTKALPVCFEAPRTKHSEKPDCFYDMVRRVTAGRRLDWFNRREIPGFETAGKEAATA